ncbi:MAG: agmatinase family protein [Bdellovibrio sp.]
MALNFDPNAKATSKDGIFGLPFSEKDSNVIYLPIPWDVTTSYGKGTSKGPDAILKASEQIDFFDLEYGMAYEVGLHLRKPSAQTKKQNVELRKLAEKIMDSDEEAIKKNKMLQVALKKVNEGSDQLNESIYTECKKLLKLKKTPIILGGDHSVPFGAIKAYAEEFEDFGILHFDAHSDTRKAYMGFEHSHASIMYNVMEKIKGVKKLVQVGIRDFCEDEYLYTEKHNKIEVHFDLELQRRKQAGETWSSIAKEIVESLPKNIYISFDIDGLDPRYCPHTGTPVPGGLEFHEVTAILAEIIKAKKTLVGFDLVEVAPGPKGDEWDANVGMRLLYKMTGAMLASQKKIKVKI